MWMSSFLKNMARAIVGALWIVIVAWLIFIFLDQPSWIKGIGVFLWFALSHAFLMTQWERS